MRGASCACGSRGGGIGEGRWRGVGEERRSKVGGGGIGEALARAGGIGLVRGASCVCEQGRGDR